MGDWRRREGVLIRKQGELESELELWKTEGGKPTIYDGMEILESAEALRPVVAPIRIWPDGHFVLCQVPWDDSPNAFAVWGPHSQQMDERLTFDRERSLGEKSDLSDEGPA